MSDDQSISIWEANDIGDIQMREVFARYGLAMYMAQVLEHGLVNALLVLSFLPKFNSFTDQHQWENAYDEFFDNEFQKTFGNLIVTIKKLNYLSSDIIDKLGIAKSKRDYLAHRFFREHDIDFLFESGRGKMISECEAIIGEFASVDQDIEKIIAPLKEQYGITDAWIEQEVAKLRKSKI